MAVTQSQYNFIRFNATGDALNFKGLLAGFILCKTGANVGMLRITDFAKGFHIVPTVAFNTNATPITVINFPEFGIPVPGIHIGLCSNMQIIAMKR